MPPSRISVALCTYNGARFLPLQLASILEQTRLPDEVIFCDDRSTDHTLELLQQFANTAPFPVKVHVNERNLGSTANFEQAVAFATGDLIAFSDQDDIWARDRLERSEAAFQESANTGLVFGDAELIDADNRAIGRRLWQHYQFGARLQGQLSSGDYLPCVQYRFVTGATVMVRSDIAQRCFPAGNGWIHDEWLAASVPLFADIQPVPAAFISYRLHASQQIGATDQVTTKDKFRMAMAGISDSKMAEAKHWGNIRAAEERTAVLCDRFRTQGLSDEGRKRLHDYEGYVDWLRLRLALPRPRIARLPMLLKHIAAYRRYGRLLGLPKDLLLPKN